MKKYIRFAVYALACTLSLFAESPKQNAVATQKTLPPALTAGTARPDKDAVIYRWTLADAKRLAMERNPTLAQAKARIDRAVANVDIAQAAYWPSLDLVASATRHRDKATRPNRDHDNNNNYRLGLASEWLLFDGFQRRFNTLSAKYGLNSSTQAHHDAHRLLLHTVSTAFYAALLAQDSMEIARQDAAFNRILLEDARKRHAGGIAPPSEVLNFELQVGNAEVDYIAAERAWRQATVIMASLLAVSEDDIWSKVELIPPPPELLHFQLSLHKLLNLAITQRPDLRIADNNIALAKAAIQAGRSGWYPRLNLFANYGFDRDDSAHFNSHLDRNVNYGLSLSWNLFNGKKTMAAVAYAYAELEAASQAKKDLLLDIDAEVRQNVLAWDSSRRQHALQESILATATRIRDLVHQEYLGGTTTITRLNEVQSDVTISAAARSRSYVQVLSNLEQLAASTGLILSSDYLSEMGDEPAEAQN
jgi:outer membrane protein